MQNTVTIYEDTSNHSYAKPQYGLSYIFGDEYNSEDIKKLNVICDNIVFREHHNQMLGIYPDFNISFTKDSTKEHNVLFRNCPLYTVKKAADQIAKCLKVDVTNECPRNNIIVLGGV